MPWSRQKEGSGSEDPDPSFCLHASRLLALQDQQDAPVAGLRGEFRRVLVPVPHPAELQVRAVPGVDREVGRTSMFSLLELKVDLPGVLGRIQPDRPLLLDMPVVPDAEGLALD